MDRKLLLQFFLWMQSIFLAKTSIEGNIALEESKNKTAHYQLYEYLMEGYRKRLVPKRNLGMPITVKLSMQIYQIIEVNEPQQFVLLNAWIIERWEDELLYWDHREFDNISEILLPFDSIWIPDTTLYNSLVMDDAETKRLINVKLTSNPEYRTAHIEMLYPTLYKFSCLLNLQFFPFDTQNCTMTFGSWTYDNKGIDYEPFGNANESLSFEHCIDNEGWHILEPFVERKSRKFACCKNNYTLLDFTLRIRRKPLFYLVNLIMPTCIITLIAIVGFFSSPAMNDIRDEKISLGITTLLSMSILIFMVSDKMPSTSSFIPLIGWFYLCMIALISGGTLSSSMVIYVQKRGQLGHRPSKKIMFWFRWLGALAWMEMPLIMKEAYRRKAKKDAMRKNRRKESLWHQLRENISNRITAMQPSTTVTSKCEQDALEPLSLNRNDSSFACVALASNEDAEDASVRISFSEDEGEQHRSYGSLEKNEISGHNLSKSGGPRGKFVRAHRVSIRRKVGVIHARKISSCHCHHPDTGSVSSMPVSRNLAELEYDWIAAVTERCCLALFCVLFLFMSFGINGIGLYNWWFAERSNSYR